MNPYPETLIADARSMIIMAVKESERSQEDVVTHLICANARHALSNLLTAFVLQNNLELPDNPTLQKLLNMCMELDARFEQLDLKKMECKLEISDQSFCLDKGMVDTCLLYAQHAFAIVNSTNPEH